MQAEAIAGEGMTSAGKVIDVGCGTATFSRLFDPSKYVGIDLDRAYVQGAQRRAPCHTFLEMDAASTGFETGSFAAGLVVGVLHHLDDAMANAVLRELGRVVRPGGRLLIMEQTHSPRKNPIGCLVNWLDKGRFIRGPQGYTELLSGVFVIDGVRQARSGFVDYVIFAFSNRLRD